MTSLHATSLVARRASSASLLLLSVLLVLCLCAGLVAGDLYLHHPAGSTNRLNEASRQRANDNRVFDSQDNNRGGYPVPSAGRMYYYEGSLLYVEWTAQHACGGNPTDNCQFVLQYSCDNTNTMRDGNTTTTIPDPFAATGNAACLGSNCDTDARYGRHESQSYWNLTRWTKRNSGLYLADQQLNGNSARYTRQNNNGAQFGYECAEERDYYPYWRPSPWKDIAVLTNQPARCAAYQAESQNVKARYQCVISSLTAAQQQQAAQGDPYIPITMNECVTAGGVWTLVPAFNIPPPLCVVLTNSSRDNHLGNPSGSSGYTYSFNWTLPNDYSESCVLRMRYNISTADFSLPAVPAVHSSDPADGGFASSSSVQSGVDYTFNHQNAAQTTTGLPVAVLAGFSASNTQNPELTDQSQSYTRGFTYKNNPYVDPFGPLVWKDPTVTPTYGSKVQQKLAINTAQFARTFQDRSFLFAIRQRPAALANANIHNVNVRGKRGNIVQVYPSVEYDFIPDQLTVTEGDMLHFQWCGGDTNPTNNDPTNANAPLGSDRSNVVLMGPTVWDESGQLTDTTTVGQWGRAQPCRIDDDVRCPFLGLSIIDLQRLALNGINASYFDLGPRQVTRTGTYHYMSTRNNAFSNRSHKGKLVVLPLNGSQPQYEAVDWGLQCDRGSSGMPEGTYVDAGQCSGQLVTSQDVYLSSGGSSSYDSDWYQLQPQQLTLQQPLWVTLPYRYLPLNQPRVYWKANATAQTLSRVGGESASGGSVTFAASAGGYYVVQNAVNAGEVAGIVLAGALLLAVCSFLYWKVRVQPLGGLEAWMRECCNRPTGGRHTSKDDEQAARQLMEPAGPVSTAV